VLRPIYPRGNRISANAKVAAGNRLLSAPRMRSRIVRDMWLTGFDAPAMHTMYVDKPMKGHGLMQAIARVNRVLPPMRRASIRRKLAAADPGHTNWQRDLSASLDRFGDVRPAAGDRAGALAAYEESLATMRKLFALDPGNQSHFR
jgi:type I restriction enzyme R subunit